MVQKDVFDGSEGVYRRVSGAGKSGAEDPYPTFQINFPSRNHFCNIKLFMVCAGIMEICLQRSIGMTSGFTWEL